MRHLTSIFVSEAASVFGPRIFVSVSVAQQLHTPTHNLILCLHTQQQFHCLQNNCKPSQQLCPQIHPPSVPLKPKKKNQKKERKLGRHWESKNGDFHWQIAGKSSPKQLARKQWMSQYFGLVDGPKNGLLASGHKFGS